MPKTVTKKEYNEQHHIPKNITDVLEENYMPYTMSVIVSRAIPEIDGLKPAHRKLLYMMYKMGLLNGPRRKSADVVGQTMQLNPHSDGAIYETLVRLTRANDAMLHPFLDSKGSFGKQYSRDMAYAASRYTEVKLDAICAELFRDIDKQAVTFVDNYNGLMKEPVLLPVTFPNVLVSPNQGIAVGMASRICGFNLTEVCEATIALLKNKNVDLLPILKAPDFSTGGELLYSEAEIRQIYQTGEGTFKLRAKYRYDKKNSCVEVYEIPYTTTVEAIMDKIAAMSKAGKIKDVTDVRDETDLKGLKITIDIRRAASPEAVMQRLFAQTTLMDSFSCNFNILVDGRPRTMGVAEILEEWLRFRVTCVRNRLNNDLAGHSAKLHLLLGMEKVLLDIDKAIRIIRLTESEDKVIPNLMAGFDISKEQAEFIAEIRLRNLNREYLLKRVGERAALEKEIAWIKEVLADPKKIDALIASELKDVIKKYGRPRRTEIVHDAPVKVAEDDLIDDYALKIFLTRHSYLKKIPLVSLRSAGEQYVKEGDAIIQDFECMNKTELLLFSDKQNVYKMKAHEIADAKPGTMGEYTVNLLESGEDERIVYITPANDYRGFMLFAYQNGKMAKVQMDAYATKLNRKKLINAYADKSALVRCVRLEADCDFVAMRGLPGQAGGDKAMLFNTVLISPVAAKNSIGVQVYTLKKNSGVSAVMSMSEAEAIFADAEFYRADSIPSTGHFLHAKDKK
ncbi:MAG: DNA topoisomerase (ATP-hydrolyzing) subunit A [Defluviitaleaceae bacterium]|nr:DNA topoisomerase (ATP-hydrolyzing) subunit A [Defluviitaleaceae bacterium]MCL2835575.1 DNA topoisomerase (ATP-hydrolyzing) subunit A [Defluviitaleaceae bacterium]